MKHEGYLFDFPGRAFDYAVPELGDDVPVAATLRAICSVVEPTVVEATTESGEIHHLVGDDKRGGAYNRTHVTEVATIDSAALVTWYASLGALETLKIADGWYRVSAAPGDTVELINQDRVHVVNHRGSAVRAPADSIIVPPFRFDLDVMGGELHLALSWSHWIDVAGVGRRQFDELRAALTHGGWKLRSEPDAESLDWRSRVREAPIIPLPKRDASSVAWTSIATQRVALGLTPQQREALADTLLAADRAASEAEESFGYSEYDPSKRRAEIVQALAVSLGHEEVEVHAFEIMELPVSNGMWTAYMKKTGAPAPAGWPTSTALPPDAPVMGVSQAEAAAFATHHGWSLPSEAEWQLAAAIIAPQLDGTSEYTTSLFAPYRGGDPAVFVEHDQLCARGSAAKLPPCIAGRRGLARDHRFKLARFRCVR